MNATLTQKTVLPADLLAMPDGSAYELVDGHLVERNMSVLSSLVEALVLQPLADHCRKQDLGWVLPSSLGYQCFPDAPNKVRRPDVSFIAKDRMSLADLQQGFCPIVPDLAAEVLSPNDLIYEVDLKVEEYPRAGVKLVWVINPEARTVMVHRLDGSATKLRNGDEISGEEVLPGFRCKITDFFPPGVLHGASGA